jgi:hypothetical protein
MKFGEIINRSKEYNIEKDLQELGLGARIGLNWLRIGIGEGFCKCGNESSA